MIQDLRVGIRMLRKNPGLATVIMGTLAVAIGMNTAIFSVVHTTLFRPLAVPGAERLVWIAIRSEREQRDIHTGRSAYLAWKQQAQSFEAITGYGNDDLALVAGGEATQERIVSIAGDFWQMSGARPAHGRLFAESDADSLVLSWGLFQRRFGGDPAAIGRPVTLNGHAFTIAGVLPRDFRFPFPQQYEQGEIDGYIPIPTGLMTLPHPVAYTVWEPAVRRLGPGPYGLHVVARLRKGVSMNEARAETQAIYGNEARQHPGVDQAFRSLTFTALQDKVAGGARRALLVLFGASGFVLLIACANIANLLMTRAASRRREIAVRTALGAGKWRLLRQSVAEGLLLSAGGIAGLALAHVALGAIKAIAPAAIPRIAETTIDGPVLWFTAAASFLTGLAFGLGPVFVLGGIGLHDALKAESGAVSARGRGRSLEAMAAAEFALAIVLLTGAGLMLKSLWRMHESPPGFTPEKILVMRVTLSGPQYGSWPPKQAYTEELLRRLRATPGVEAAGIHSGSMNTNVRVDNREIFAAVRGVSSGYLQAMGSPLVKGSWPAEGGLFGVVVNEAFARLAGIDVTGRHIGGFILNETITGVVADFKTTQLDADPPPEIYVAYERLPVNRSMRVAIRAKAASALAPTVRETVRQVDPTQPVYEFSTLEQALSESIAPRRFNLFLLGAFAATAMLLAAIGIYGVIAYSVAQRTREIGVRIALGARPGEIARMIAGQGMRVATVGIVLGLAASAALTRLMSSLLYDVKPNDLATFVTVALVLAIIALAACCAPALRAASVDPMVALRHE